MPPKKPTNASTPKAQCSKGKTKAIISDTPSDQSESDEEYIPEECELQGTKQASQKKQKFPQQAASPRFLNDTAQEKFCKYAIRPIHVERTFVISDPYYCDIIKFHKWETLTAGPESCNVAIAKEFYANAAATKPDEMAEKGVYVRGKYLKITSHAVNKHYGLPDYKVDKFTEFFQAGNPDTVLHSVALPGEDWSRNAWGDPTHVFLKQLNAETKTWLLFLNSRLMPMTHNTKIMKERLFLVYAVKNRLTVNVGKFITTYITQALHEENLAIYFPHFLLEFAMQQGVKISLGEECRTSMGPIRDSQLRNYQRQEQAERQRIEEEARENAAREAREEANREIPQPAEAQPNIVNQPTGPQALANFDNMHNALEGLQTSLQQQHNTLMHHIDAMEGRWTGVQDSMGIIGTRLDSIVHEHTTRWSAIDNRLDQCQTEVHNLNLMMVYHHQSRGPNSYFPPLEEMNSQAQRMIVDTSSRRVVMQQGMSTHAGASAPNFRGVQPNFSGFSRFANQPSPPGT